MAAGTEPPDLEERVAALEAAIASPPRIVTFPQVLTEDELAKFREDFDTARHQPPQFTPQPPPLTPEEIRHLLRECVTVVGPGETLIVRVPVTWGPEQVGDYQRAFTSLAEQLKLPFRPIVVIGDELAVIQPEPDFMDRTKVERLDGPVHTIRLTHEPTGITIAARDRAEGIVKLRKALTDHARREHDLQEAERRRQRKEPEGTPGAA